MLSNITIYPIKSCRGIALPSALLEPRGLRYDRRWMLVDSEGLFITQREYPRMTLIDVTLEEGGLLVHAPGTKPLRVPFAAPASQELSVTVWSDAVKAVSAGDAAAAWFSEFLGVPCRLVTMTEHSVRFVDAAYAVQNDVVSFADAFPLLLISEASLAELNSRLEGPIPMKRFRPNLVVSGCGPFEEDTWKRIRIGDIEMHVVKPCARCTITTVDTEAGVKTDEPLRTLARYRSVNNKVMFGQNVIHNGTGNLVVGSELHVLERTS